MYSQTTTGQGMSARARMTHPFPVSVNHAPSCGGHEGLDPWKGSQERTHEPLRLTSTDCVVDIVVGMFVRQRGGAAV